MFLWGYDRSLYNVWQFGYENSGARFWKDLFDDTTFKCYLAKRWFELTDVNQTLNYNTIVSKIDEYVTLLSESKLREQERWGTVSEQTTNIVEMKTWIQNRINWMNTNIGTADNCINVTVPNLVISKIHYKPEDNGGYSSKNLEFIEITNNSNQNVNLTGYYIRELGISYQFPENSVIAANQKIYLCSNTTAFEDYYGITSFGQFTRNLSNSSYHIILADAFGNTIDEVHYKDDAPWPESPDGDGPYLELIDLDSDNSLATNWTASSETLSDKDISIINQNILVYPNPTNSLLNFKLNSYKTKLLDFIIYNTLGQSVGNFQLNANNLQIDISYLNNGIYYYSIKNGQEIIMKNKIIKQ